MRRFVAVALLLLVIATACFVVIKYNRAQAVDDLRYFAEQKSNRAKAEDDIREAVFRYQMDHYKSGVYFLAIDNHDPSNSFMGRFKGCKPPVKKLSEAKFESKGPSTRDKKTGAKGVILKSWDIRWLSDAVELSGDDLWIPHCGNGYSFRVEVKNERWVVKEAKWLTIY